ncbi:MAG: CPBP family intramembrane metalloprotease [Bacilli bacterium]|nr:CPBP family intramembrane metalloprotease [Bacilli bacterium]
MENNFKKNRTIYLVALLLITLLISRLFIPIALSATGYDIELTSYVKIFIGQIFGFIIPIILFLYITKVKRKLGLENEALYDLKTLKSEKEFKYFHILILTIIFFIFNKFFIEGLNNIDSYFYDIYNINPIAEATLFKDFLVLILLYAILPAFIEEITFRGIYFVSFEKNKYLLFIIPTIVFALSHKGFSSVISAVIIGLYLMLIMYKTRSLKLVIGLHLLYNVLSLVFSNYIKLPFFVNQIKEGIYFKDNFLGGFLICFGISVIALVGLGLYYSYIKKTVLIEPIEKMSLEKVYKKDIVASILLIVIALIFFGFSNF